MVLEAPTPEKVNFIKEFNKKLIGFWRGAQNMEYGPGDAKAGNIKFIKDIGFWRSAQTRKYSPGDAYAANSKFRKRI